jgi:hypothetical protein
MDAFLRVDSDLPWGTPEKLVYWFRRRIRPVLPEAMKHDPLKKAAAYCILSHDHAELPADQLSAQR